MNYYELPSDMQDEIKKLASEHPVTLDKALEYYMMGGYEHGKTLCQLNLLGYSDEVIRLYSYGYWKEKRKQLGEKCGTESKDTIRGRRLSDLESKIFHGWSDIFDTVKEDELNEILKSYT